MNCLIVGTGPSIKDVSLPLEADLIIAVNQSLRYFEKQLRKPDIWFTLDPSKRNLDIAENYIDLYPMCKFIVACDDNFELSNKLIRIKRKSCFRERHNGILEKLGSIKTLSEVEGVVHTGNSLWGALQLAYQRKPEKIAILGLDATQEPSHISEHKPYTLYHLPELF